LCGIRMPQKWAWGETHLKQSAYCLYGHYLVIHAR
jgi:hypothetical protein